MRIQKFILCTAIALTAFGASLGLLEIGAYLRAAFQPLKVEFKPIEPIRSPIAAPPNIPNFPPPAFTPTVESEPVEESEPEDWGNTGNYYIIDEKPKGFEDVTGLDFTDREWNEKAKKVLPVAPSGSLNTYLEKRDELKTYDFSGINIKGNRLSLVTETKRGVSFRFEGRFVEEEVELKTENGEKYDETVYLKGRLSKWRDGVKIAEAKVRMSISHGC